MKSRNLFKGCLLAGMLALVLNIASPVFGQTILVDFGPDTGANGATTSSPDTNSNYWNNSNTSLFNVANLITTANATTGIALTWSQLGAGANSAGTLGVTAAPGLLNILTAYEDAVFTTSTTVNNSFTLTGLNPAKTYTLKLFGSRDQTQVRTTDFSVVGATTVSGSLQTSGTNLGGAGINHNIANTFDATLAPDGSNQIVVNYKVNTGGFAYLNSMQIDIVPEPTTWALLAGSLTVMMVFRRRRRD